MRSPIQWLGGKGRMVKTILPLFPSHELYAEPFGGGASLLFAKEPSKIEVYNDLDSGLVNMFRTLADPSAFPKFMRIVEALPYSRGLWREFTDEWRDEPDFIRRAAMWFYMARGSFGGLTGSSWGFTVSTSNGGMASVVASFISTVNRLPKVHARLKNVIIENHSYKTILEKYDSPTSFFYLDPPYVPETRVAGTYAHEMSQEDHEEMVDRLLQLKGKAILSGYDHPVYSRLLKHGWSIHQKATSAFARGHTRSTKGQNLSKRMETVYTSWKTSLF